MTSNTTSSAKINMDGTLLFEQPFVRVPYENYRKVFRTHQKHIERELSSVQTAAKEIGSKVKAGTITKQEASKLLEAMIGRTETLKRKLADLHARNGKPTLDVMRDRLNHLGTLESVESLHDPEYSRWLDTRLDRWLVDWNLRAGRDSTAKKLAKQKQIETLVDIDLFSDIQRIETALLNHSCTEALAWCSDNKSALKKSKNTLEFDLRLQEYIELCRQKKTAEAIPYLRKYLAPWNETHESQIATAAALIIYNASTKSAPSRRLYDPSRWNSLVRAFRQSVYALNSLPSEPLLHLSLYAGLAALKLPACFDSETKNVDCPVCDGESSNVNQGFGLGVLAEEVPLNRHQNSTIVCRITGKIMDHDNMPMAFPNGFVYSREALEDMAAKNSGIVTCPRTNVTCEFSALRKVFIS